MADENLAGAIFVLVVCAVIIAVYVWDFLWRSLTSPPSLPDKIRQAAAYDVRKDWRPQWEMLSGWTWVRISGAPPPWDYRWERWRQGKGYETKNALYDLEGF